MISAGGRMRGRHLEFRAERIVEPLGHFQLLTPRGASGLLMHISARAREPEFASPMRIYAVKLLTRSLKCKDLPSQSSPRFCHSNEKRLLRCLICCIHLKKGPEGGCDGTLYCCTCALQNPDDESRNKIEKKIVTDFTAPHTARQNHHATACCSIEWRSSIARQLLSLPPFSFASPRMEMEGSRHSSVVAASSVQAPITCKDARREIFSAKTNSLIQNENYDISGRFRILSPVEV